MKVVNGMLVIFGAISLSSCAVSNKLQVVNGKDNSRIPGAMVYVWVYRFSGPPVACIRTTNALGEADFSDTPVKGRWYTYVAIKEGYYPMGGVNDGNAAKLIKVPAKERLTDNDISLVMNFYHSSPKQNFVDVPIRRFRTQEGLLNVDELVMGLEDSTPDHLKERWIEAFKAFVALRE
jgi:hypothetical protein